MQEMTWYGISDGYGVVGTGWECPYCENQHNWVFYSDVNETVVCEKCKKESITTEEMDWWLPILNY